MAYPAQRGCSATGARLATDGGRGVTFNGQPPRTLNTSPRSPDGYGDLFAFASGEDPGTAGYGQWYWTPDLPAAQPIAPWRSEWVGRFRDDGTYVFSAKQDRAHFYTWAEGDGLRGPFPSGTSNIEGIVGFRVDGSPIWQNRAQPVTRGPYTCSQYFLTGGWFVGLEKGTQRLLAQDAAGVWYLVTTTTSPLLPNPRAQGDGSLLIAWNGDAASWFDSRDGWTRIPGTLPSPLPPDDTAPDTVTSRLHACAFGGWTGRGPSIMPGTIAWSTPDYDRRPRYEGMPWARDLPADVPIWALTIGTEAEVPAPYPDKTAQIADTIAYARTRACAVVVYADTPLRWTGDADALYQACVAGGVRVVAGVEVFAVAGLTPTAAYDRAVATINDLRARNRRVVLISTARDRAGQTVALCPWVQRLVQRYTTTVVGHVVMPGPLVSVRDYWAAVWATMPSGAVDPL